VHRAGPHVLCISCHLRGGSECLVPRRMYALRSLRPGERGLMQYLAAVRGLEKQFKGFTLQHVERNKNEEADTLAKAAAKGEALPSDVFYHIIGTPAVRNPEGLQITQDVDGHRIVILINAEDWRAPITLYLQGHYHPSDRNEAKRLKHRSRDFTIVNGQLYKKESTSLC
jgi:hypothetical protein